MLAAGLEQYKDFIHYYNMLLEKNVNLKRENRCLKINYKSFEKFAEEQNNRFHIDIQERLECEKTNSEKLQILKCLLCEKEKVVIQCSHLFHSFFGQIDNVKDCLGSLINNMCKKLESIEDGKPCTRNIKRTVCSRSENPGNRLYPCEKVLMIQQNFCEHNVSGDRQKLMCVLQECFDSKNACVPIRTLLEQSKIAICCLIREMGTENIDLKVCQDRDTELYTMKNDLVYLTAEMKKIQSQKLDLESGLSILNEKLLTQSQMNEELLTESEKQKDELVNMKHCLDMRINEKKTVSRELCEKNQLIEDQVKTTQEMEGKLCDVEKKIQEAETLRIICTDKCRQLTDQNTQLENDLKNEKTGSCNKDNEIVNLREQIVNLEIMIKSFDIQRSLYEEQIKKLEKEKSATECKLNEMTNNFNRICQKSEEELTMTKSELGFVQGCLKQKDKENLCLSEKIKQLEYNIGNLEKTILESNCVNESLVKKLTLCQSELILSKDKVECLKIRVDEMTNACEEQTKQRLQVEENMEAVQKVYEETKTKNDWLTSKSSKLEWDNCKLMTEIKELNVSLDCERKKEAEVLKDKGKRANSLMGVDQLPPTAVIEILKIYQLPSTKCTNCPQPNVPVALTCYTI